MDRHQGIHRLMASQSPRVLAVRTGWPHVFLAVVVALDEVPPVGSDVRREGEREVMMDTSGSEVSSSWLDQRPQQRRARRTTSEMYA